jgi:3-methyl-2-oxobutanoate hydroxymethyltransferase
VVLETVPAALATLITKRISVPTIGIGAGVGCDGQVQIINDILGSYPDFVPKHTKQYIKIATIMADAIAQYHNEVKNGKFPTDAQSFPMDESILTNLGK